MDEKFSYKWSYAEYPSDAVIHFLLFASNPIQRVVTIEVVEYFPDDIPEIGCESCQIGWNYLINEILSSHLALSV